MRSKVNILLGIAFIFALMISGCSKEEPLTPMNSANPTAELRGGADDDDNSGNDDDNDDGITDPNDDEDEEVDNKGGKGKGGGITDPNEDDDEAGASPGK